jgi:cyclic pyranopterin phosphate synthase
LTALRNGEEVLPLIHQSIAAKAAQLGGQFTQDYQHLQAENIQNRSMITIGG